MAPSSQSEAKALVYAFSKRIEGEPHGQHLVCEVGARQGNSFPPQSALRLLSTT